MNQRTTMVARRAGGATRLRALLAVVLIMFVLSVGVSGCNNCSGPPVYYSFDYPPLERLATAVTAGIEIIHQAAGCEFLEEVPNGNQHFVIYTWDNCWGGQARYACGDCKGDVYLPSAMCPYQWPEMAAHEIIHILGHHGHDDPALQPNSIMRPYLNGPPMRVEPDDVEWLSSTFCEVQ